jgi:branched-chain amino acid transport system substrate-binding protein
MYLFQVKSPEESKYAYDYYKLLKIVAGDEAFRPIEQGNCPMIRK